MNRRPSVIPSLLAVSLLLSTVPGGAATWTPLTNLAPSGTGVMLQLTDGSVLIENGSNLKTWFRLRPDPSGNYANGAFTTTAAMSTGRLYFGSEVLPDGRLWVLGGEYTGPSAFANWSNTGEIYDPVADTWTPITPYPNQAGCPSISTITGNRTSGSNIITSIYPYTTGLSVGEGIGGTGTGIPAGTTITSIDSSTQIHISANATLTVTAGALSLSSNYQLTGCFGDDPTMLIPGGTAGQILAGDLINGKSFIYDIGANSWTQSGTKVYSGEASDEEGWVKLSDGTILTYDLFKSIATGGSYAEKYNPVAGTWSGISPSDGTAMGTIPVLSSSALGYELGPLLRLQDGRVLVVGANQHTGLYTPGTNTWAAGPDIMGTLSGNPAPFGADDAPAAILPNGHVIIAADAGPSPVISTGTVTAASKVVTGLTSTALIQVNWPVSGTGIASGSRVASVDSPTQVTLTSNATSTGTPTLTFGGLFTFPTQLFDFNPSNNSISPLATAIPDASLANRSAYTTRMLLLPTGQLLFSDSTSQLYLYTPDGTPSPALRPVINKVAYNGGGSFTLTGKQLNGQSAGAAYGDDVESNSNYPIVRFNDSAGNVYYAKTTNWSSYGVGTSTTPQTVNFTLNPTLTTPGNYSVVVSGAGIQSFPVIVNITQAEINQQ